jgi:SAM-dependent methyltransferase
VEAGRGERRRGGGLYPGSVGSLTDRTVLVGQAYASAGPLEARRAIYRWQQPPRDLPGAALSFLQDVTGLVVDVGCGPGQYLSRIASERPGLQVLGLDLSAGMRPHAVADAQQLPLADRVASAVLAMHMLYHVPDIDRAIGEIARILRPGGVAIVATNGHGHMRQFRDLFADAVRAANHAAMTSRPVSGSTVGHRFRLENAPAMLRRHFVSAEVISWQTKLRIPEAGPVVAYLDSQRASRADQLPAGVSWEAMIGVAHGLVECVIARDGAFTADSHSGLIVCRRTDGPPSPCASA